MNIIIISLGILALLILFWQTSNLISVFFGSPFVKSDFKIVDNVLEEVNLKQNDIFYELGSGTGSVLIEASKKGARCIGYEISPYYFLLSKLNTLNNKNISICFQNIKTVDLSKADVIFVYLLPKLLEKIDFQSKQKESKVISIGFPIKGLKLLKTFNLQKRKAFLYQ